MLLKTAFGSLLVASALAVPPFADDVTGEIKLLTWQGGGELDTLHKVEQAFTAKHPGVTFKEIIPSGTGHPASLMRTVLAGGEPIDLMVNTWPWFREELAATGLLRPIDDLWKKDNWDQYLTPAWKVLGQTGGVTYGVEYNFGNRSAFFYLNSSLDKAGVKPPATWDDLVGSFPKFKVAGITRSPLRPRISATPNSSLRCLIASVA
jgi:ABC-type glycerol-3-phosphate transport system substrate-binding protein